MRHIYSYILFLSFICFIFFLAKLGRIWRLHFEMMTTMMLLTAAGSCLKISNRNVIIHIISEEGQMENQECRVFSYCLRSFFYSVLPNSYMDSVPAMHACWIQKGGNTLLEYLVNEIRDEETRNSFFCTNMCK